MSVNSKMTAIADQIRELRGMSGSLSLDTMNTRLEEVRGYISDAFTAIGNKGGSLPGYQVSQNLATAINSIPAGVTVQRKTGTFTTNTSGTATVNVGFQPDVVYIQGSSVTDSGETHSYSQAIVFSEENRTNPDTVMWHSDGLTDMIWERTSTGFSVYVYNWDWDWNDTAANRESFTYVAIKYT